jgi:hypothetical protein
MPPKKKTKVGGKIANDLVVAVHQQEDIMADILSWLLVKDVMRSRRVCKKWKEAVKKTIVPLSRFGLVVNNVDNYEAMRVITRVMPNIQQLVLKDLGLCSRTYRPGLPLKYSDGEDADAKRAAKTADYTAHDIGIISNFSKLRLMKIYGGASLNGRYPSLFSFPLLQKLIIVRCKYLQFDLEMVAAGLPVLKELECGFIRGLTGNINSLRMLKDTLENVQIDTCPRVEGNFMDLADFPHLKVFWMANSAVTGDIRDIGENDFQSLTMLTLPNGVYGGRGYELQRISDAPDLIRAVYQLKKQRSALDMKHWYGELSEDSPDWYESVDDDEYDIYPPPFYIRFVEAGSRVGYQWATDGGLRGKYNESCEVNWLDPEPDADSSDYEEYIEKFQKIENNVNVYHGFHQPPTEEEYHRLVEESYGFDESDEEE